MTEQLILDIKDKLNGFEITGKKVFLVTRPTTLYPKGKWYNGKVTFVNQTYVSLVDDMEGFVKVYFSEIMSPADIKESTK